MDESIQALNRSINALTKLQSLLIQQVDGVNGLQKALLEYNLELNNILQMLEKVEGTHHV